MKIYRGEDIVNLRDDGSIGLIEDLVIDKCNFLSCFFSTTQDIKRRTLARNIVFSNCYQRNCVIDAGLVEDVVVENLKCGSLLQFWGTAFKHVVFKGKVGRIMISPLLLTSTAPESIQSDFNEDNEKYYRSVDWALDISDAYFNSCEIRGVDANLIKRDADTQVVVNREKLLRFDLNEIDFKGTYFDVTLKLFKERGDENIILVAPKLDKSFSIFKKVNDDLVEIGLAQR